jgi:hypothetical protein
MSRKPKEPNPKTVLAKLKRKYKAMRAMVDAFDQSSYQIVHEIRNDSSAFQSWYLYAIACQRKLTLKCDEIFEQTKWFADHAASLDADTIVDLKAFFKLIDDFALEKQGEQMLWQIYVTRI